MTYRIVNFSYINNGMVNTISATYNIYNEDGSIHRSNLRKSIRLSESSEIILESEETVNIINALSNVELFILQELEA